MHKVLLSIALVTRNRPQSLERTLRSLRAQDVQPYEVVVSDDSDDEHAHEVEQIVNIYQCRYIRGPRRGLYANRNHTFSVCSGTHIRTMDDDHEFPQGHIKVCMEAVQSEPETIWIIGEHYPYTVNTHIAPVCPGQLHARGFSFASFDPQNCWAISDGATIYPATISASGNVFYEGFKFGSAYLEYGSRLFWLKHSIKQLTATFVIHDYNPSSRSFADEKVNMSSRIFAMLCHSFVYQPSKKNQFLCLLEIFKLLLVSHRLAFHSIKDGFYAYKQHCWMLSRLLNYNS